MKIKGAEGFTVMQREAATEIRAEIMTRKLGLCVAIFTSAMELLSFR